MGIAPEETELLLQEYREEAFALERQLVQITWFMRGGITLDQAFQMNNRQRKMALSLIEENIERTNKSGQMMH